MDEFTEAVYAIAVALVSLKLGGTVTPMQAPPLPPTEKGFDGVVERTNTLVLAGRLPDSGWTALKRIEAPDEYLILPYRAQVAPGTTVTWTNTGKMAHGLV